MTIAASSSPLSMQEIQEIENDKTLGPAAPKVLRLVQEIYRERRIAKEILIEREAQVTMGGDNPSVDSIWNHAKELIGPRTKDGR